MEKDDLDDGGSEMIGAILKAREARGTNCWIFDQCVAVCGRSDGDDSGGIV